MTWGQSGQSGARLRDGKIVKNPPAVFLHNEKRT